MSLMLQNMPLYFQRFAIASGNSEQHNCDMDTAGSMQIWPLRDARGGRRCVSPAYVDVMDAWQAERVRCALLW